MNLSAIIARTAIVLILLCGCSCNHRPATLADLVEQRAARIHQYRVCWISSYTKATGCGAPTDKQTARDWANIANREFPRIHHYIKSVSK